MNNEYKIVNNLMQSVTQITVMSVRFTKYFTQGVGLLLFNYLIMNLVAFQSLAFLYYFVDFQYAPNYYRRQISQVMETLQCKGGYQLAINYAFHTNLTLNDPF
jgi:hypothetical protein